jgi:hypothetical protein
MVGRWQFRIFGLGEHEGAEHARSRMNGRINATEEMDDKIVLIVAVHHWHLSVTDHMRHLLERYVGSVQGA